MVCCLGVIGTHFVVDFGVWFAGGFGFYLVGLGVSLRLFWSRPFRFELYFI